MALRINDITRRNGPACDHIVMGIQREAQTGNILTSFGEIDALVDQLGGTGEADKALVMLWMNYRRRQSRPFVGVDIA